jgi:MarR family transcriptional regulator, organic hydroperoxide resistance regulator
MELGEDSTGAVSDLRRQAGIATDVRRIVAGAAPVGLALALLARAHRAEMQHRFADLGLHVGQEWLILDLHHNPGTTQAALVARLGVEQPVVARAVGRLERAGFVACSADPDDRRVTRLRLTGRGEAVVAAINEAWVQVERRATAGLDGAEVTELVRLMTAVRDNLVRPAPAARPARRHEEG